MAVLERVFFACILLAALGSGLVAGVFFIFSVAIMRALERVPGGMAAMQSINVVILNPMFLGVFLGTAVLSLVLIVASLFSWHPGSAWVLAGALIYLVGSLAITVIFNVPMNNALVAADAETPEGQNIWADYLTNWTRWNHVRTIASLAASGSFILAVANR